MEVEAGAKERMHHSAGLGTGGKESKRKGEKIETCNENTEGMYEWSKSSFAIVLVCFYWTSFCLFVFFAHEYLLSSFSVHLCLCLHARVVL